MNPKWNTDPFTPNGNTLRPHYIEVSGKPTTNLFFAHQKRVFGNLTKNEPYQTWVKRIIERQKMAKQKAAEERKKKVNISIT